MVFERVATDCEKSPEHVTSFQNRRADESDETLEAAFMNGMIEMEDHRLETQINDIWEEIEETIMLRMQEEQSNYEAPHPLVRTVGIDSLNHLSPFEQEQAQTLLTDYQMSIVRTISLDQMITRERMEQLRRETESAEEPVSLPSFPSQEAQDPAEEGEITEEPPSGHCPLGPVRCVVCRIETARL
ncbi:hypothetical protein L596_001611 [Steinernema carpocapsae]|uniref:Uncharacterized protein n=2 Tax=Steinernema carpocapsae TaxID=34508 RepID=A0A4U8UNR5_STECR|nr:hypothetical protein L596_001611 [Steinernema carpocapsae]